MKVKLLAIGSLVLIVISVCSIAMARNSHKREIELSSQIKGVLAANYPNSSIQEVDKENVEIKVFEVELALEDGRKIDVLIASDGTIMSVKNDIQISSLPFDASKTIPAGAKISETESEIRHAVFAPVKLDPTQQLYELELVIDGREVEYKIASDGTVLNQKIEKRDDDHRGNYEGDDDNGGEDDD